MVMKIFASVLKILLLLFISIQLGMSESVKLNNGTLFEAKIYSVENGFHVFEIPKSQIIQIKYKNRDEDKDYISFISNTNISTDIIKFVNGNYYIKINNNDINTIGNITTIGEDDLLLSTKTTTTPLVKSDFFLRIHGSNTIGAKLAPALIKAYLSKIGATDIISVVKGKEEQEIQAALSNKNIKVEIAAHGSSTGFKDLNDNLCDIAMASRRVKDKEVVVLQRFGNMKSMKNEHVIAIDGVAVFVNQKNPIFKLDTTQIKDIYKGSIDDWSKVNGKSGEINLYARDKQSGTWDTFNKLILNKEPLSPKTKRYEDNTLLSNDVSKDINGIGFGGLPYILNAKELAISDGETTIRPDIYTVATEDYPLSRRLYLYTHATISKNVKDFIDFTLSSEGQKIVQDIGFVDLNIKEFQPILSNDMPKEYRKLVKGLSRLSTNFRFNSENDKPDNKAKKDLSRLAKYFRENSCNKKAIYLIGFSDSIGDNSANLILSKKRAQSAMIYLASQGIKIDENNIIGFGEAYPVASNNLRSPKASR
jgi:phosphate transport system substrate-binding protein